MKKILAIIWKDTLIRFSSPSEWLFFLILPIFFTMVLAGGTGSSSDTRIRLIVVDQASSPLSIEFIDALEKSNSIRPDILALTKAENEFSQRKASAFLIIPPEFDIDHIRTGQVQLELRQQPNNVNALAAYQAVQAVIKQTASTVEIANQSTIAAEKIRPFDSPLERSAFFDTALLSAQKEISAAPTRMQVIRGETKDPVEYDPAANSSAGQLITWVFIPLFGISAMFAFERNSGTLRRLLTTRTRRSTYMLATLLGQVFWALVQMLLLIIFSSLVMKTNWGQSPAALAVILISSVLAAAAIGIALGAFVKTDSQASSLSVMLGMVMALLGGCWYPLELFPTAVQNVVKILPTYWAMQGILDIVLRHQSLMAVLPEAAVLSGFAIVFFSIGVLRFRYE